MEITEVRISPGKGGKIRAFASIVIDDCFVINDVRIIEARNDQLVVAMPSRKSKGGHRRDIAHPLNAETRRVVEQRVLDEFQAAVENHVVPETTAESGDGDQEPDSLLDRLASRLLSDEYWVRGKK